MAPPLVQGLAGALLGAILGSYLATLYLRWPAGRSTRAGRSSCDGCGRALAAVDLFPILSFAWLKGRCRRCGTRIDPSHLAVELASLLIGGLAFALLPLPTAVATAALAWWMLILALLDAAHRWLPDRLTLPLIPAGLVVALAGVGPPVLPRMAGAIVGYAALAGIGLAYEKLRGRRGLGGGDPKMLAGIAAWIGWQSLPLLILVASFLGLASIALRRAAGRAVDPGEPLPFGTYLALAALPIWLWTIRYPS